MSSRKAHSSETPSTHLRCSLTRVDLNTVIGFRRATTRADLVLAPGERILGGGTWLFSEPQPESSGLVDLTTMGWPALEYSTDGLRIGATCTIAELSRIPPLDGWAAHPLFFQCATALLASFKIWNLATVGGNVCRSYAAASMVSLAVALDGVEPAPARRGAAGDRSARAGVVRADGVPQGRPGPARPFRRRPHRTRRSRRCGGPDDHRSHGTTDRAALPRPPQRRRPAHDVESADGYYTDPLGTADWRRQVSRVLLEEIRTELAAA